MSSGIYTLEVDSMVHPPLIDVVMHFRTYKVVLTTDISKMYREIQLEESDQDYHRFLWRRSASKRLPHEESHIWWRFAANMSIMKKNEGVEKAI